MRSNSSAIDLAIRFVCARGLQRVIRCLSILLSSAAHLMSHADARALCRAAGAPSRCHWQPEAGLPD